MEFWMEITVVVRMLLSGASPFVVCNGGFSIRISAQTSPQCHS